MDLLILVVADLRLESLRFEVSDRFCSSSWFSISFFFTELKDLSRGGEFAVRARVAAQAAGGAAGRAVALGTCASQGERLPRRGSWLGVLLAVTRVTGI